MIEIKDYAVVITEGGTRFTFPKDLPKKYHKRIEEAIHKAYYKGINDKLQEIKNALDIPDDKDWYISYD